MPNHTVSTNVDTMLRAADNAAIRTAIGVGTGDSPTFAGLVSPTLSQTAGSAQAWLTGPAAGNPYLWVVSLNGSAKLDLNNAGNLNISSMSLNGDAILSRDAAGILAQRNGTSAQALRVYNTFPGTGNNEYAEIAWSGNIFSVRPAASGSGSIRESIFGSPSSNTYIDANIMYFRTSSSARWAINSAGGFLAVADNNYDIGASGGNRPRNIYVAGTLYGEVIKGNTLFSDALIRNWSNPLRFVGSRFQFDTDNQAGTGIIQIGGTTSAFPAIKRNGTGIDIKLADDSTYAPLAAASLSLGVAVPTADLDIAKTWNAPAINVTGASGNGTTATITFATQATAIPVGSTIVVASINPAGYNGTFVVTASTVTSVSYLNATSAAWVSGGTIERIFTSVKLNVTDTASNAVSKLMDLQVGGVSKANILKNGLIYAASTITSPIGFTVSNSLDSSNQSASLTAQSLTVPSGAVIGFSNAASGFGSLDTMLYRDGAAGILAQRNSFNAQAFRIYNDYYDGANFSRFALGFSGGVLNIGVEKGGTGSNLGVAIKSLVGVAIHVGTLATNVWNFANTGHFLAALDNTYDIGASGANRPRTGYFATSVVAGSVNISGNQINLGNSAGLLQVSGTSLQLGSSTTTSVILFGGTAGSPILGLGGITSAFPAIKRVGTGIHTVLGDESGYANVTSGGFYTGNVASLTGSGLTLDAGTFIRWNSSSKVYSPSDGVLLLTNNAVSGFTRLELGATNLGISRGTGSPEGVVTALVGSLYIRTDGGASTTLYVKESSPTPTTGWVAK
jgi:hypothetical protein